MSALEEFAKAFRDAVSRAKLSSSRVEAVKQAATKCFDRAQLAKAEVLQIHHGASDSAASICSLYLFDAASRHAKDVVRKNGAGLDPVKVLPSTKQAGDPKAALISAAKEFLSEMSTIVMEVTEETARMASAEQKEKVLKVIDIWRKANTFDGSLLDTVSERIKSTRSSNAGESSKAGHPRSTTPVGVPPPDHGARMASAHGGSGTAGSSSLSSARGVATPPPPPVSGPGPPGLPANLAALLGANGSQEQQNGGSNGQQQAPSNTESFMASLSSLVGQGGARNDGSAQQTSDTAAPQFDLSQLTALQQQYANPQQQQQQQQPPPQQQQQIQQAALSHFPPGGLAQPTKPPQPAEASGASTWPPAQNPSAGDLSDFDPFSFDPTRPENWTPLAQRWANTYGYMPSLSELGLNFLMFFQTAMMQQQQQQQQGGMGGGSSSM